MRSSPLHLPGCGARPATMTSAPRERSAQALEAQLKKKKKKKALEVGRSVADSSRQVQLYIIIITQAGLRTSAPPYYVT